MNGIDLNALERWAEVREASLPLAKAIFDIAHDDDEAHRIWESPTPDEKAKVESIAFSRYAPDEEVLHWGIEKITRA